MPDNRKIAGRILDFLSGGTASRRDPAHRRKILMVNVITLLAIVILIPMGLVAHLQGNTLRAVLDHIMAVVLSGLLVYLHRSQRYQPTAGIGIGLMGVFFAYLFVTGGTDNTGHLWYYTFPLFAAFLLGSRNGLLASMLLLAPALVVIVFQHRLPPSLQLYPWEFSARFLPSFLVVAAYSFAFERLREKSFGELRLKTRQIERANAELHQEIAERLKVEEDLKNARRIAEKANRAKSEFLSNMSHELRTPLNHIIGFTELVVDKHFGELNVEQAEYLQDVLGSSRHLLSLVNDILDLSKVEAGRLDLVIAPVDLRALLEGSLTMIREKARKHRISLRLQIGDLPPEFAGDERKLKQILYNLLANAVKFTHDGGTIALSAGLTQMAETGAQAVSVNVVDTGIGIDPADIERIFDPFEQVESSASRRFEGTGLGLSLTRRLVEAHGGRIRAESFGQDRGSRFTVTLPIRSGAASPEGKGPEKPIGP